MGNKQGQPENEKRQAKEQTKAQSRVSATSTSVAVVENSKESVNDDTGEPVENVPTEEEPEIIKKIPFVAELGSGRGWPPDSTVVCYHNPTGLVIVGTESGAICAYGDGFQYMQPAIDTVDITHLVSLNDDSILVGFADNCLAVLMLPSLNLSHKLPASWLNDVCGDITTLYVDEKHFRPYAYVGTSEGYVRVLQVLPDFREVEYCVTCADTGMTGDMAVSALEISPKDERYLMIAYDSNDEKSGAVVIYDMVKHKTYKVYKSVGITTAVFSHTGEALYAGTRSGEVLSLGIEKSSSVSVWSSRTELINEDECVESDIPIIRKMQWMLPQHQQGSEEGCLFVLLGSFGLDTDILKSVIVALYPSAQGNMRTIYSVPPQNSVEIMGFRIVSTCEKEKTQFEAPVPALLLLGQSSGESREFKRELMITRCPASPISEWELEIGMLPDPRVAVEFLPGKTNVTCITGCIAGSALAEAFISMEGNIADTSTEPHVAPVVAEDDEDADEAEDQVAPMAAKRTSTRRVSMRDFYNDVNLSQINFDALADRNSTWEMVLANGEREEIETMDVLFVGHDDGSIIAWGVSMPRVHSEDDATGNCWIPLTALHCGATEITHLSHTNTALVAGDDRGTFVVWNCERKSAVEKFRHVLDDCVSCACMDTTGMSLFVGTRSGIVHTVADWNSGKVIPLTGIASTPARGCVQHMFMAPFWRDTDYQPAVFITYASGHVVVVHVFTREVLACSNCFYDDDELEDYEEAQEQRVVAACVVNAKCELVTAIPEVDPESSAHIETQPSSDSIGTDSSLSPSGKASTSFMKKFKRNSTDSNILPPLGPFPTPAPRYVIIVQGTSVRRCDIRNFARIYPTGHTDSSPGGNISRPIAASKIVCANFTSYIEDAARFWTQPIPTIVCVDDTADMYVVTLRSGSAMSRFDALPQVLAEPYDITSATVLPNGNAFICSSNNMIFTSSPSDKEFLQTQHLPSRASTLFSPPDPALRLAAPEQEVAGAKKAKRRSSFLMSAPADLDKLFLKTYEQRQKDELFRSNKPREERSSEHKISREGVTDANTSASRTKATLDETRKNFEERGERLSKLNQKMEDMGLEAKKYKANSAAHKEKMRKKAQKWGVF